MEKTRWFLALINFDLKENAMVTVNVNNGASEYNAEEYHLKQDGNELNSKTMMVNDVKMVYDEGKFPAIHSVKGNGRTVNMQPATLAFVVLSPKSLD